jgi:YD repeat-containing protein
MPGKIIAVTLLIIFILAGSIASAQYYYQDILTSRTNHEHFQLYKKQKVSRIMVKSFEADGAPSEGFNFEQNFNNSFTQLRTSTSLKSGSKSSLVNYYNASGYLYRTVDSTDEAVSIYEYSYDSTGNPVSILNTSRAIGEKSKSTESHIWQYNAQGKPVKMLRVRDEKDTSEVQFVLDDKGNVIEEQSYRKGTGGEKIYYYYNEENRLTDIVRYYDKLGKLLPDYTFDYYPDGRVSEMRTTQGGGADYLIWKYAYAETGLKSKELCYNKQKKLVGKVEYEYESRK